VRGCWGEVGRLRGWSRWFVLHGARRIVNIFRVYILDILNIILDLLK
jgi:hypothetical protein